MELSLTLKAYLLLATAILNGETYSMAGADYFVAACYLDGFEMEYCIDVKNQGVLNGDFPIYLED